MTDKPHLFITFGDTPISIAELGPIADMPLAQAMQAIVDNGFLGEAIRGIPWTDVIVPGGLSLEKTPEPDDVLLYTLYDQLKTTEQDYAEAVVNNQPTEELREKMLQASRAYRSARKLSTP